jgi:hypothetical protein
MSELLPEPEVTADQQEKPPPTIDTQTGGDDTDLEATATPESKPPSTIDPETRGG